MENRCADVPYFFALYLEFVEARASLQHASEFYLQAMSYSANMFDFSPSLIAIGAVVLAMSNSNVIGKHDHTEDVSKFAAVDRRYTFYILTLDSPKSFSV